MGTRGTDGRDDIKVECKDKLRLLLTGALAVLLLTGLAAASPDFALPWSVFSSGGGFTSSTNYGLEGTLGQGAVGVAESPSYKLGSGFWPGVGGASAVTTPMPGLTGTPTATATATVPAGSPTPTVEPGERSTVYLPAVLRLGP